MANPPIVRRRGPAARLGANASTTRRGTEAGAGLGVEVDRLSRVVRSTGQGSGRKLRDVSSTEIIVRYTLDDIYTSSTPFVIPGDGGIWNFDAWYHAGGEEPTGGLPRYGWLYLDGPGEMLSVKIPLGTPEPGDTWEFGLHNSETFRAEDDITITNTPVVVPGTVSAAITFKAVRIGTIS